ncbi:HD domain-containing protein [Pseudomonas chlororaphis]|uniref:Phosphohydrolase n=1 Tax=Pseudomonas chlororaphis TaxID=587753 RepID=A0A1Q8ETD4_9PSED|nr:HD domain-containing protein [Pseudomonas chlororaphis]OLF55048.1 phosphohydrolase [Pseudomonas chlororaphis]
MTADAFAPLSDLAATLLPHALGPVADGAHDLSHLQRVWANVRRIAQEDGGDLHVLLAATLLHDCVAVEKNSPLRAQASRLSAEKASALLRQLGWPEARVAAVAHAIAAHSFSAAIEPTTLEAWILQDADRLDALGAVGVARTFYVGGRLNRALYDACDPRAQHRDYDDSRFTLDHFHTKLLHLAEGFRTRTGAHLAQVRHARLKRFMDELVEEIDG